MMRVIARIVYSHWNQPMTTREPKRRKPRKAQIEPRKEPSQARSKSTRNAILQAAARILSQSGLTALNTNAVAHVAGVSVGSLYQYYPNKAALLSALSERHHSEIAEQLTEFADELAARSAKPTLHDTVSALVRLSLAHQFAHAKLAAALEYAERELPESAALQALHQQILHVTTGILQCYRREIRGDLTIVALDVLTIATAILDGAALRLEPNSMVLKRRVERAILGYLSGT
jgi:AcrR family transcriptional regulator